MLFLTTHFLLFFIFDYFNIFTIITSSINAFKFKKLPKDVRLNLIKPFLNTDDKIKLFLVVPNKQNNIFKNRTELFRYWLEINESKDLLKNMNMINYVKLTNIQTELTSKKLYTLLKESASNLNIELFIFLFDKLYITTNELKALMFLLFFYNKELNKIEQKCQLDLIKYLLGKNYEIISDGLNNNFQLILKSFNFLLVEYVVENNIINISKTVYDKPNFFRVVTELAFNANDNQTDFFIKTFKYVLTKVDNLNQENVYGQNIKQFIIIYLMRTRQLKQIFLNLVFGDFFNTRKKF